MGSERKFANPSLQEVRMWRVKGFEKYLIFYRPLEDGVEILHVMHGARDYKTLFDPDEDNSTRDM